MTEGNRTVRDLQRLAGRRGPREGHAVTWSDIDALMAEIAARSVSSGGKFAQSLGSGFEGAFSYEDTAKLIADRIDTTVRYVNNEVDTARAALQEIIDNEATLRAQEDTAIETAIADLTATVGLNTAAISTIEVAYADADTALSGRIDTVEASVDQNTSSITSEQIARVNADSALASDITTLSTSFNDLESSITVQASTLSTLESYNAATYAIRLKAGGATNSIEFVAADDPIDGPTSAVRFTADDVLFDGTVYARHIAAETITAEEIAAGAITAEKLAVGSITADMIDTRGLDIRDGTGNVLFSSTVPLDWMNVGGANKPEDNANRITSTSQISDGAGLGLTASWTYVSGSGKPANNADVTGSNYALGTSGGDVSVNSGLAARAVRVSGSTDGVYAFYGRHFTYGNGAIYGRSFGGFSGQFLNTASSGSGETAFCAVDGKNTSTGAGAKLGSSYGLQVYAGGIYNNTGAWPFTAGHDGMIAKTASYELGDIVVEGDILISKLNNSFSEFKLSTVPSQKNAFGVLTKVTADWTLPASFINETATLAASKAHEPTMEEPALDPITTHNVEDYSGDFYYALTNSIGEGAVNVCGEGGDIQAGDLIVTSSTPGKGMKQADDIVRTTTVARARQDCTFASPGEVKQVACVYMCG